MNRWKTCSIIFESLIIICNEKITWHYYIICEWLNTNYKIYLIRLQICIKYNKRNKNIYQIKYTNDAPGR